MNKVALLITNIPNPYRIPLFNELNDQLKEKGIQLKVIFGAYGYARRKWHIDYHDIHFEYEILPSKSIKFLNQEKVIFTYPGLFKRIIGIDPNVVITNAFSIASTKLWWRSLFFKKLAYIIWSGAISRPGEPENILRKLQRRALVRRASGFISYGTRAKQYLIALGANQDQITISFNTVDTLYFAKETLRMRKQISSDEKKHLLYVGHFTKGKRLDVLLQAIKNIILIRRDIILDLVGTGPEEAILKTLSEKWGIEEYVQFHGFRQKQELPFYFAQADCFLFPSEYDVWGLVLVEAMAAGIPCIASIHAGATIDLIQDEVTGYAIDFENIEVLIKKINWILINESKSEKMGENAKKYIMEKINIKAAAERFVDAICKVMN